MFSSYATYGQDEKGLFEEIPKASNVGDTVTINNYYSNGRATDYVLLRIDKNDRYMYKKLDVWRYKVLVTYDGQNRVKSYKFSYNEGLWGSAGKGIKIINYDAIGNVKNLSYIDYYNIGTGELCFSNSSMDIGISGIHRNTGLICFAAYKKGGNVYLTDDWLLDNKELRKKIKNSVLEEKNDLIEDFPFKLFILK